MECTQIEGKALKTLPLLFDCQEEYGRLKIATPYLYPNGDYVDLYLTETHTGVYLTDLGETMGYLADANISLKQSPKRRKIVNDVLLNQGVELFRGELRILINDWDKIAWYLMRLGQAIVQISDLIFTLRLSALVTFKEEVEEYWIETETPYEPHRTVIGGSGESYTIDFYIPTPHHPYLVETLASSSTGYANTLVSRVVRTWHDVRRVDGRYGYISLIDDSTDVWKEAWFDQLAELSNVIVWGERDELLTVLGTKDRGRMISSFPL